MEVPLFTFFSHKTPVLHIFPRFICSIVPVLSRGVGAYTVPNNAIQVKIGRKAIWVSSG